MIKVVVKSGMTLYEVMRDKSKINHRTEDRVRLYCEMVKHEKPMTPAMQRIGMLRVGKIIEVPTAAEFGEAWRKRCEKETAIHE